MTTPVQIRYEFSFEDGTERRFDVDLDPVSLTQVAAPGDDSHPEWTLLGHHKCTACPLRDADSPRCPVAVSVAPVVEAFSRSLSTEEVTVRVSTESRTYSKQTSLYSGISSLLGLLMATSGCPTLDRLRPMVLTHLPFATPQETTYRMVSMYLLDQHFRMEQGEEPDWQMTGLARLLQEVREVNRSFCRRMESACVMDANMNAVVTLDCFAAMAGFSLEDQQRRLDELRELFRPAHQGQPAVEPSVPSPQAGE